MLTKTTTKTIETTEILTVINGNGPGLTYLSCEPISKRTVSLVVGAPWEDACASVFSRKSLTGLIEELTKLRDALEPHKE